MGVAGRSSGSRFILRAAFPAITTSGFRPIVVAYSGGSAGVSHPSSLFIPLRVPAASSLGDVEMAVK